MGVPLRERLGALSVRDYRLLFSAGTITTVGDRMAGIALAAIGVEETLWLAIAIFLVATAIIVAIPSVRAIRAPEAGDDLAPTMPA